MDKKLTEFTEQQINLKGGIRGYTVSNKVPAFVEPRTIKSGQACVDSLESKGYLVESVRDGIALQSRDSITRIFVLYMETHEQIIDLLTTNPKYCINMLDSTLGSTGYKMSEQDIEEKKEAIRRADARESIEQKLFKGKNNTKAGMSEK